MKTFTYEMGHKAGSTITVAELRDLLAGYPDEMPVMATWEGVNAYIDPEYSEVRHVSKGGNDGCDCLVFDVEQY